MTTEEDNDFEFKDYKEEAQDNAANANLNPNLAESSSSGNKPTAKSPEDNVQGFELLPLDKSLENANTLINNEVVIRDENAYNKDLKVTTVANTVLEALLAEFEDEDRKSVV